MDERLSRPSVAPSVPTTPSGGDDFVTHVTHRSMGTQFVVMLPQHQAHRVEAVLESLEMLDEIEARLTVYQQSSEVSRINREAGSDWVVLSQETFELIEKSILWSRRTSGAFDVTSGPLVEAWGFTQRQGKKPSSQAIETALKQVGYAGVELDRENHSLRFRVPGMSINLGAIGKGDALDRLTRNLLHWGVEDFLIHGGKSSVVGRGDQTLGSDQGWAVGIAHPTKPQHRVAGIWLKDSALATSGSGQQFFHHRGKRYGHVIDPRTGYPAGNALSLTVMVDGAADADACATALFVASEAELEVFAQEDWSPPTVTIRPAQRQDEVEIVSRGEIRWVEDEAPQD